MKRRRNGFSLIELIVALAAGLVLTAGMLTLFHQSERAVRDQTVLMEMQQTARAVVGQIADEVRMAGQGVPVYASSFDAIPSEATAVILKSSSSTRIDFRAGLTNIETAVATAGPMDFSIGASRNVSVDAGSAFTTGKFVYVWGPGVYSPSTWLRGLLTAVSASSLTLTPQQTGSADGAVHFAGPPIVSLEEAVSISWSSGAVRRATTKDASDPANLVWNAANEIGRNVTDLRFTYYDSAGNAVLPSSLADRTAITRVDVAITVDAGGLLSNGTRLSYSLSTRTMLRNARK